MTISEGFPKVLEEGGVTAKIYINRLMSLLCCPTRRGWVAAAELDPARVLPQRCGRGARLLRGLEPCNLEGDAPFDAPRRYCRAGPFQPPRELLVRHRPKQGVLVGFPRPVLRFENRDLQLLPAPLHGISAELQTRSDLPVRRGPQQPLLIGGPLAPTPQALLGRGHYPEGLRGSNLHPAIEPELRHRGAECFGTLAE
jgi:hypothetical protein